MNKTQGRKNWGKMTPRLNVRGISQLGEYLPVPLGKGPKLPSHCKTPDCGMCWSCVHAALSKNRKGRSPGIHDLCSSKGREIAQSQTKAQRNHLHSEMGGVTGHKALQKNIKSDLFILL